MTNQKTSLREKVAVGVAYLGLAGMIGGGISASISLDRTYPTLTKEAIVVHELKSLENNTWANETATSLKNYPIFKEEYTRTLESKLQEVRALPQYAAETQKREEDYKTTGKGFALMFLSTLLSCGAIVYGTNQYKKSNPPHTATQPSGASQ